jgi:hypothetical protein
LGSDRKIFGVVYAVRPLTLEELGWSSALAARAQKKDGSDRALTNFNTVFFETLRMFIDFFSLLANLKTFVARYNGKY